MNLCVLNNEHLENKHNVALQLKRSNKNLSDSEKKQKKTEIILSFISALDTGDIKFEVLQYP